MSQIDLREQVILSVAKDLDSMSRSLTSFGTMLRIVWVIRVCFEFRDSSFEFGAAVWVRTDR
jgi:hypothetical protein